MHNKMQHCRTISITELSALPNCKHCRTRNAVVFRSRQTRLGIARLVAYSQTRQVTSMLYAAKRTYTAAERISTLRKDYAVTQGMTLTRA